MSLKSRFPGLFDKKHGKGDQRLSKSSQRHLYHICWSLWPKFSWKKSMLMLWKILRLFVNTLSADDKDSLLNRNNLTQPNQILLSQKQKTFSEFFFTFSKSTLNFELSKKKDDPHSRSISQITVSEKGWLDKCMKNYASEYPTTNNMINGHKLCCNLEDRNFTIFIDHFEIHSVGKCPYYGYANS